MKMRLALAMFAISLLSACGGGGGGSGGSTAPVIAPPTSAPTLTPAPLPTVPPTPQPSASAPPSTLTLSWTSAVLAQGVPPQTGGINLFAAAQTATLVATEAGYSGLFSVSACAGVTNPSVTVSPIAGSSSNFLITANNVAGTCKIVIGDASGQAASLQATVTLTGGAFQ